MILGARLAISSRCVMGRADVDVSGAPGLSSKTQASIHTVCEHVGNGKVESLRLPLRTGQLLVPSR